MRNLLRHRVNVRQRTRADDVYLSETTTWTWRARNLRCRITPVKVSERVFYEREGVKATHKMVWMKKGARTVTIASTDEIVWGARTFKVTGVHDEGEMGEFMVATLLEET